jgi:FtsZ-binding cell division protein ZapB
MGLFGYNEKKYNLANAAIEERLGELIKASEGLNHEVCADMLRRALENQKAILPYGKRRVNKYLKRHLSEHDREIMQLFDLFEKAARGKYLMAMEDCADSILTMVIDRAISCAYCVGTYMITQSAVARATEAENLARERQLLQMEILGLGEPKADEQIAVTVKRDTLKNEDEQLERRQAIILDSHKEYKDMLDRMKGKLREYTDKKDEPPKDGGEPKDK